MLARTPEDRRFAALANKIDELHVAITHLEEVIKKALGQKPPAKTPVKVSEPAANRVPAQKSHVRPRLSQREALDVWRSAFVSVIAGADHDRRLVGDQPLKDRGGWPGGGKIAVDSNSTCPISIAALS